MCTCPSRALIQRSIYDQFLGDGLARVGKVRQGNPLDPETMIGAQASNDQLEKILSYIEIGKAGGAKLLTGGERVDLGGELSGGYYVQPTVFEARTTCGSSRRRSSARCSRSRRSTPSTTRSRSRTTPSTASAPACGAATATPPTAPAERSRLDASGPTPTTSTGARRVRRVQAVRHRSREPPQDARPLPADEEPARVVRRRRDGLLLIRGAGVVAAIPALVTPGCCPGVTPVFGFEGEEGCQTSHAWT